MLLSILTNNILSVVDTVTSSPVSTTPLPVTNSNDGSVRGVLDTTSINGYDVYITNFFKFYAVISKSANFDQNTLSSVFDALDRWSYILRDTVLPGQTQPSTLYNGQSYVTNPLRSPPSFPAWMPSGANDGYVIMVHQFSANLNILGAASYTYIRNNPGELYHHLPSVGYLYLNTLKTADMLSSVTPCGRNELFNVTLHEVGHALGFGTNWFTRAGTKLTRSFVVGAGDYSANPLYGTNGNIFYSIDRGDGSRTSNDVGQIINNFGSASYPFAYNPDTPMGNTSMAVSAYNETFSRSVTAIPLENGLTIGSYGAHWAEGGGEYVGDMAGSDYRQYYNSTNPGVPALQDELMTPISEGSYDTPLSKISLGAMVDLGWTVDMTCADHFDPYTHVIRYNVDKTSFELKKNNFGGFIETKNARGNVIIFHLRKQIAYHFINQTGETLNVTDLFGTAVGVAVNGSDSSGAYMQWTAPNNISTYNNCVYIRGTTAGIAMVWKVV